MISIRRSAICRGAVAAVAGLALLGTAAGCGGKKAVFHVHGKVLDGKNKPAKGTVLFFNPADGDVADNVKPVATVGEDGEYELTTYAAGDGAPAGDYVITMIRPAAKRSPLDHEGGDLLKGQYASPATSKITFTVEKGADNEVPPIQLPY